jgi:hypothetical protein
MTEREQRPGSGGTEDNVRDEFAGATEHGRSGKDTAKGAEQEEQSGGGGVKGNVQDEWDESQQKDPAEQEEQSGGGGVKDNVQDEWDESQRH